MAAVVACWAIICWVPGLGGDGATAAILRPGLAVVALVAVALTTTATIRRTRIELLAAGPGPIAVLPIVDRTGALRAPASESTLTPLARQMTHEFQRSLSNTRLYRSTALPTPGSSTEFLDIVAQAGESASVPWAPVVRLLRLLAPMSAFRVRCELFEKSDDPADLPNSRREDGRERSRQRDKVVHVELVRLPSAAVAPAIIHEETWEEAIEHAAHWVAAAILPQTRLCRTPPWTPWRGRRIPRDLFHLVQRFEAERTARRFDEALATLRRARALDPGNLALRLELGKLQETMDMHLDALLTYDDIISRASRTSRRLSRWWNARPGDHAVPWSDRTGAPALRQGHPVVQVARYRHAVLLGLGDKLAAQWWHRDLGCPRHRGARELRREYLRRILSDRFTSRYAEIGAELVKGAGIAPLDDILSDRRTDLPEEQRRASEKDARIFFTTTGAVELERLVAERRARPWRRLLRRYRELLPRRSLELALLSAYLRRVMAMVHAERRDKTPPPTAPPRRVLRVPSWQEESRGLATGGEWPPAVAGVQALVASIVLPSAGALSSWHEHYNAACVFALLLFPPDIFKAAERRPGDRPGDNPAARLAIDELGKAVECWDSGYLASQRTWLLTEDPDLDQLRRFRVFRDFEARTFGSVGRAYQRGPRLGIWQQAKHVDELIADSGERMAELWTGRAVSVRTRPPSPAAVRQWVEDEREGWRLAGILAVDHRDWATRHSIARTISEWSETTAIDLERKPHPLYSEDVLARQLSSMMGLTVVRALSPDAGPATTIAKKLKAAMIHGDRRLQQLGEIVRAGGAGLDHLCCERARPPALQLEWTRLIKAVDGGALVTPDLVLWCEKSSARWAALSAWFDDHALGQGTVVARRRSFAAEMKPVAVGSRPAPKTPSPRHADVSESWMTTEPGIG
ncbi:hypothetical protein [Actinomycetospora chiangmaiensis]|uniref:hypothetical protein n=1 Tax=Actinomycetospora chiangmaiensis TaxID=402650 RepID=UPI0012F9D5E6|nr:hypothetical protein [Actinomycetospora chiangmaiensis]